MSKNRSQKFIIKRSYLNSGVRLHLYSYTTHALTLRVEVNRRVVAMKAYSTLPRSPEVELHHLIRFSVIPRILFFSSGLVLPQGREYNQHILSSANRVSQLQKQIKSSEILTRLCWTRVEVQSMGQTINVYVWICEWIVKNNPNWKKITVMLSSSKSINDSLKCNFMFLFFTASFFISPSSCH